ncbi:ABC transporter ATP-binding protein [Candidatus Bipolaricaulota bacterium]|nr:ABC transporter ATP-binding protein [Candidatus Bipolaricaulota bacterium]
MTKSLWGLIWTYRRRVFAGFLALVIVDAAGMGVPLIVRDAIDRISRGDGQLLRSALLIAALAAVAMLFRFLWRYFFIGSSRRIERNLRAQLFRHLLNQPASFYNEHRTGDLMAHATNDIDAVTRACGFGVLTIADPLLMIPVAMGIMLSIDSRLTLLAILPLPLLTLMMLGFGKIIHHRFEAVQEGFSTLMEKVRENVAGIHVVKSFVQEEGTERDFSRSNQSYVDRNMHLVRVWGMFHPLIELLSGATLAIVLWIGGSAVIRAQLTLGDFVAFTQYLSMLAWPMIGLGWAVNIVQRGRASLDRINQLLAVAPAIATPESPRPLQGTSIEFRNLSFRFPGAEREGRPALEGVNLRIGEGETLGVVGLTGAGKSTLGYLIPRLFDPPPETVHVGGTDVRALDLAELRGAIGYVPQDPFLFQATVAENIAYGHPDAPRESVEEAARQAGIHDEILAFPNGYDTEVGERGISLSGGQKQRVAIARALLLDPRILILDDPLSAVDAEREEFILGNLRDVFRERTTLVIAHRISAVMDADRIIVLEQGRIVEEGGHHQLVEAGGTYQRIWTLQQAERQVNPA